ncbi:ATP-binding cassette domain-containing protein [Marininema halotolerans]|uniref:ABC transporter n=1 Tax=Marininema halotolerans TaxID=1155944 RepID=A0A1I6QH71_9BACL|nr:ATP-binding cassette domain-containing protein [Marininema halotolerans]SFS51823.1 ABC transporter [Marininema halotolerans]
MESLSLRKFSVIHKGLNYFPFSINTTWEANSAVALYGPSGTGRTSWLLSIGGLMSPSTGEVFIEGRGGQRPLKPRDIGVGPIRDLIPLFPTLTIEEHIKMHIRLFRAGSIKQRTHQLLQNWRLETVKDQRVMDVNRHLRMRAGIAVALAHQPHLLLLDDPEEGMTGSEWQHLWADLSETIAQYSMILITTTMREETVKLCSHHLDFSQTTEAHP